MDIERLKKLIQSEDSDLWDYKEELIALIDDAMQAYRPWIDCRKRMPTENDADENGHILAYSEGLQQSTICLWYHIIGDNTTTHWRKNVEPPKGE